MVRRLELLRWLPAGTRADVGASPAGRRRVTLSWPDAGLRLRYHVYLRGPGEPGDAPVKITQRTGVTITGLQPGDYQATVTPVNFKKQTGRAATVTFTVP